MADQDKTPKETPQDKADQQIEKNVRAQAAKDNAVSGKNVRRARFVGGVFYPVEELEQMTPEQIEELDSIAAQTSVAKTTPIGNLTDDELEAELARRKNGGKPIKKQLDHDDDGAEGGSKTKAQIASELSALGVEFDATKNRDELAAVLKDAKASQKK